MAVTVCYLFLLLPLITSGVWQVDRDPNLEAVIQGNDNGIQWFVGNETAPDHFKILLTDGDAMLVGARNMVYNISLPSLSLNSKLEWYSRSFVVELCKGKQKSLEECQNYIRVLVKKSHDHYLVCGTNAYKPWCRTYKQEGLDYRIADANGEGEDGSGICPGDPKHNSTAVYTDGELYSATVADIVNRDPLIFRNMIRTQRASEWLNEPNFVNSMAYGEKVYFFMRETAVENINCGKTVFSRIARVCKQDQGGGALLRGFWSSFFKARLNCSIPGEYPFYFNEIQSTSDLGKGNFMSTYDSGNRSDIVYGVFTTPVNSISGSAICAYRMSDIDAAFRGQFKGQASADANWLPVPEEKVPKMDMHKCVNDTRRNIPPPTLAFIKSHPLMDEAVPSVGGAPLLVQANLGARFTQIAIDWQVLAADNRYYDVMFVGTDDGRVIKAINKGRGAAIEPVIIEEIQVFQSREAIVSLRVFRKPELGQEKLIVVSRDNIISVPLHRCHKRLSCRGCVALQDPYCSWADDKCSNSNRGLQGILTGKHSYCKDTADVGNVVTPGRGKPYNDDKEEASNKISSNEEPVVGTLATGEKMFAASTLAVGIVVAIVVSMIVGFGAGYMVSQCRRPPQNTDSMARERKLPPLPLRKSQNQLDDYIGQSDPNLYHSKQLNVVLNVPPKSNKLPNSSAETKPAHKSNKVYL
ncbi:semaphorin-1A-like isoform X2 [Liolophura sinensis]|uniref:semaphorin-1A-like isoform X2 n=1 Tax=Liolophura sinensis TaxID=3198878 RepID=UPI0031584ADD